MGMTNKSTQEIFGKNLKYLRELKNENQEMVGELIGLTKKSISLIERGLFKSLDLEHLKILSQHYGVSIDNMIDEKFNPDPTKKILTLDFEQDVGQPPDKAAPKHLETQIQILELKNEVLELKLKLKEQNTNDI